MTELAKLLARRAIAQLRLVAQSEQRLLAACRLSLAGNVEHFVNRQVRLSAAARRARKGAVVADVSAELCKRDEDLARISDELAMSFVPAASRDSQQRL